MQDCIKELTQEKNNGKVRKFEVRCPNYGVRKRLPENDDCHYCRKENPKTTFIFTGNPPYGSIKSDAFRCGKIFVFGFDAGGKGNPYFESV